MDTFIYAYIYPQIYTDTAQTTQHTYNTCTHYITYMHINKYIHILHAYTQNKQRVHWAVPPALSLQEWKMLRIGHIILNLSIYGNYWRSYTVFKQGQTAFSDWENEIIVLKTGWKLGRAWTCKSFHVSSLELLESISGLQPYASKDLLRLGINRHWNLATLT